MSNESRVWSLWLVSFLVGLRTYQYPLVFYVLAFILFAFTKILCKNNIEYFISCSYHLYTRPTGVVTVWSGFEGEGGHFISCPFGTPQAVTCGTLPCNCPGTTELRVQGSLTCTTQCADQALLLLTELPMQYSTHQSIQQSVSPY
jgi:hypothetical protein